jgi:hypothetical protein
LHLLTAGVTLCIMASLNPLSLESFESKLGIRRLMEMQVSLKPNSIVADQGHQLLKKLLSLVMRKETQSMLDFGSQELEPPNQYRMAEANSPTHSAPSSQNVRAGDMGVVSESLRSQPIGSSVSPDRHPSTERAHNEPPPLLPETSMQAPSLDFCEDIFMSQTMLEIEQGRYTPCSIS